MRLNIIKTGFGVVVALAMLLVVPRSLEAQGASVEGTITDAASNAPIADARVTVGGTRLQGVTNARGFYRITNIPAGTITLQVQRIGYKTLSTTVTLAEGQSFTGDYAVTASVLMLEEVVVTGTAGKMERRAQGALVEDLNVADLANKVPLNVATDALQSRIPGVSVTSASGSSGTSNQIRIRGAASISLSNEPLLYVDGIRVVSAGAPQWFTGGQAYERLNDLEPEDIESMEIVKGPAAATLYGADATAGVIQVITKRGRPGSGRFTQNIILDYNSLDRNFTPRTNYARCRAQDTAFAGHALCFGLPVNTLVSDNPLLRQNAFRTGHTVGINWSGRGGGTNYGYYTSLNKEVEDGVLPNNGFERNSGRVNFNWIPSQNLTLDAGVGVTVSLTDLPDNDNNIFGWLGNAQLGTPLTRTVVDTGPNGWFGRSRDVPAMKLIENQRQTHRTIGTLTANWTPHPNFTHRFTAGMDWLREEDRRFLPKNSRGSYSINTGQIQEARRGIERYTLDYLGNWRHNVSPSVESNVSFGFQLVDTRDELVFATGEGLTTNPNNVVTGASLRSGGQEWFLTRAIGLIGQWQVGLNNRLYGQVGLRFDNASTFGRDAQWVTLPKVSVSWVPSEEPFWNFGFINTLRLRAAWGTTGRIPQAGASLTTLQSVPYYDAAIAPGAIPQNPGNPGLRFERGQEIEGGFDATFLSDRLGLDLTYFDKRSRDLLLQQQLAPSEGWTQNPWVNIGELVNSGLEISLRGVPINKPGLSWDVRVGMNTLHNEVTDMGSGEDSVPPFGVLNRVEEGWQLGAWRTRKIVNVDTLTGVVTVTENNVFAGNVLPTFEANFSTNLTIKRNLRFYALVDTKQGHKVRNFTDFFRETQLVRSNARLDTTVLSKVERMRRYGNPNAGGAVPAFVTETSGSPMTVNEVQDEYIQDASFFRLRELSLTYTLPDRFARLVRAASASFTLAGQNLAIWTKYEGFDPEVVSNAVALYNRDDFFTQPPVRRAVFRMNLTF